MSPLEIGSGPHGADLGRVVVRAIVPTLEGGNQYQITGVLGRGGFGTVYRADLTDGLGFTKQVALKLLSDSNPPERMLQRFRDEARILGLLRDRAVVQVDPPVKLGERWAVVMEYVEGASLGQLIEHHGGGLPPTVGLAIIAELSRALHQIWNQPGPDNAPLRLRHRDIKPDNIQLTRSGTVKMLDFGIAKADFDAREVKTTSEMHGTPGYIAPERYYGEEGSTTDVFSLGVVLHVLLVGAKPRKKVAQDGLDLTKLADAALKLAAQMMELDPEERPEPREVRRVAERLLKRFPGQDLGTWAETHVPDTATLDDPLIGTTLTRPIKTAPRTNKALAAASGALGLSGLLVAGITLVFAALVVIGAGLYAAGITPQVIGIPVNISVFNFLSPEPDPVPARPVPARRPVPAPAPEPLPVPEPGPVPEPVPAPAPEPAPAPAPSTVAAASQRAKQRVSFVSLPPDAAVSIDGARTGVTPFTTELAAGTHTVVFTLEGASKPTTITISKGSPKRYLWRVSSGKVELGY